jgi:hypothetical protein
MCLLQAALIGWEEENWRCCSTAIDEELGEEKR